MGKYTEERRMRRAANRRGLTLYRSRTRGRVWPDEADGYHLVNSKTAVVHAGKNYDLTIAQVAELLRDIRPPKRREVL